MPVKNYFDNLYKIWGQHSFLAQRLVYAETCQNVGWMTHDSGRDRMIKSYPSRRLFRHPGASQGFSP